MPRTMMVALCVTGYHLAIVPRTPSVSDVIRVPIEGKVRLIKSNKPLALPLPANVYFDIVEDD